MKLCPPRLPSWILALLLSSAGAFAQEEKREGKDERVRPWGKAERESSEAWESLGPEQREKLREALREVWNDPAVISAREEVKHASDAYQAAVKAAVARHDPSLVEALAKLQGSVKGFGGAAFSGSGAPPRGPGVPGGPGGAGVRRGFDGPFRPPGFLESLSPEMRERYRKAEATANESEPVKQARDVLSKLRSEDEALRRRRLEAFLELRRATVEGIIEADPELESLRRRLLEGQRPGGGRLKEGEVRAPGRKSDGKQVGGSDPKGSDDDEASKEAGTEGEEEAGAKEEVK